jgi:hypothetical protein
MSIELANNHVQQLVLPGVNFPLFKAANYRTWAHMANPSSSNTSSSALSTETRLIPPAMSSLKPAATVRSDWLMDRSCKESLPSPYPKKGKLFGNGTANIHLCMASSLDLLSTSPPHMPKLSIAPPRTTYGSHWPKNTARAATIRRTIPRCPTTSTNIHS